MNPARGTKETEHFFTVNASDQDEDSLLYVWNFGDGDKSMEKNPSHIYKQEGIFRPSVVVSDGEGLQDTCTPIWVVVGE